MNLLRRLAARLPTNALRVYFYRLSGVQIGRNVTIGYKTSISSKLCILGDNVAIGSHCSIAAHKFVVGRDSRILSHNRFIGKGSVTIGENARIINEHFFDCWHDIVIGDRTWIAGQRSQFWTHGTTDTKDDQRILIGDDVYVGSGVLFAPGSQVANQTLVALGAVVAHAFDEPKCVIGGNPAKVIRRDYIWRDHWA